MFLPKSNLSKFFITITAILIFSGANIHPDDTDKRLVEGRIGNAIRFNGITDEIVCPPNPALDIQDAITISAWIKDRGSSHKDGYIAKANAYELRKRGSGGLYFWIYFGKHYKSGVWAPKKFKLQKNKWTHVAVTYDAKSGIGKAYINGKKVNEYDQRKASPDLKSYRLDKSRFPLTIGTCQGLHAASTIDEVRLYNRALDDNEIAKLPFGKELTENGLVGYWPLDEIVMPERTIADEGTNSLDGRLSGEQVELPSLARKLNVPIIAKAVAQTLWTQNATDKVFKKDVPVSSEKIVPAKVFMARNERESIQLALHSTTGLENVNIEVTELKNKDGNVFPADKIEIRELAYVPVTEPSQTAIKNKTVYGEAAGGNIFQKQTSRAGWYPDPLPIAKVSSLRGGENKTWWITATTTSKTTPGVYRGKAFVTADGIEPLEATLEITVWDFSLPEVFHSENVARFNTKLPPENLKKLYSFFARNNFVATPLLPEPKVHFEGTQAIIETEDFDRMAEYVLDDLKVNNFFLPLVGWSSLGFQYIEKQVGSKWQGFQICGPGGVLHEEFQAAFESYIKVMGDHLRQKGWIKKARIMPIDEPHSEQSFQAIRQASEIIKRVAPEIMVYETKWPMEKLVGSVDTWCLGYFEHDKMKEALSRGEKIHWYPNWLPIIDRPGMNTRVIGWFMFKYNLSGILLWATNYRWGGSIEQAWLSPRYDYPDGRVIWGNGSFLYPNKDMLPEPSIRWELYRETFEDHEYLYRLRELTNTAMKDGAPQRARAVAISAKNYVRGMVNKIAISYETYQGKPEKTNVDWSTDSSLVYGARRNIAKYITDLQNALAKSDAQEF